MVEVFKSRPWREVQGDSLVESIVLSLLPPENSRYFCDFCEICYFFYIFLLAVFFKSFLLKLRTQFASKLLLTRSILDISEKVTHLAWSPGFNNFLRIFG